jgi:hypothetical protein
MYVYLHGKTGPENTMFCRSWSFQISMIFLFIFIFIIGPAPMQGATNTKQIKYSLREIWQDNNWTNTSKSEYYYDSSGKQNKIFDTTWRSNAWKDTVLITNGYNAQGLLSERQEKRLSTDFVLSHELYEYDDKGNLVLISFPDIPWFRARGIFKTRVNPFAPIPVISVNPYLVTSHIHEMQFKYSASGLLDQIRYVSSGDKIQSAPFSGVKLHPLKTRTLFLKDYSDATLDAYGDSLWNISPSNNDLIPKIQEFSYQTNGNQVAALSLQDQTAIGSDIDRQWDFYEIWHPCETRTVWFYSKEAVPDSVNALVLSHVNPRKQQAIFSNMLDFWLKSSAADRPLYLMQLDAGVEDAIVTKYYSSRIEENRSMVNYYIPGNYYQYEYEPRFRSSYPIRNRQIIKIVEQFMLPTNKLDSPTVYGFGWDYDFQWINSFERDFRYDGSGRLAESIISTWEWEGINPENGAWKNDMSGMTAQKPGTCGKELFLYMKMPRHPVLNNRRHPPLR